MGTLWQDVRHGLRMLARNPGFAVVVVLILGLGLGAATAVFSIVNGVLLHALPHRDPDRLAVLFSTYPERNERRSTVSGMNFQDWQRHNQLFEAMAVMLASFGIYGVIAHSVRQRTPEIGIRMALGATSGKVRRAVLREGLKLAAVGVLVGVAGALVLTRIIAGFLYNVSPTDPVTFVGTALLLTGVALFSCWLPARRAARIDPMAALRYE